MRGGHRDLIVEQPAHGRAAVEAVRDPGAGAVAGDDDALERLQRELAERGVVEELARRAASADTICAFHPA